MTDHDPWQFQKTKETNEKEEIELGPGHNDTKNVQIVEGLEQTGQHAEEKQEIDKTQLAFEDNFAPSTPSDAQLNNRIASKQSTHQPLADSASYLQSLERKLEKLKKGSKLVDALSEKRQDCMRTLLQNDGGAGESVLNNNEILALDTPISNNSRESGVQEFLRHLQPIQPVTVGEIVQIVDHDHLEHQREAVDKEEEKLEDEAASESLA